MSPCTMYPETAPCALVEPRHTNPYGPTRDVPEPAPFVLLALALSLYMRRRTR